VETAGDGEEGFEAASSGGFDLVITDIQMPYMTGLELAAKLAGRADTKSLPVIVLTARGYKLDRESIDGTGIRAILSKPFSPREVLTHVQEILEEGRGEAA
jgi:two-component system phosphate regulon response regulator PhoB